jgi:modulator of FtsH protease HflC
MNRNPFTLTIGCLLLLIFGLLLCVFQVRQSQIAVVTTFSKPTRPITEAGAHWKLPWPIQKVYKFDQRIQNFADTPSEGLTSDSFGLVTSVYVGWKITDVTIFFPKFAGSADPIAAAEKGLELLLSNARSAVVSKHPLSDFLSTGDHGTNFTTIESEILETVQSQLRANNYGLVLEYLGLKRVQLPSSVTQTVIERMQAERKVLADKFQFEGEAEAQKIRSGAELRAAEVLTKAEFEATRIRGEGEAEAAKSLTVFQQNPELASFIFRLNALEGSLKDRSILVFDQRIPPFDLFRGMWAATNLMNK